MENKNVDITQKSVVTCVEWFHGYGGNALGLKRAIPGLRPVAVCERDAFVVANMVSKMEARLLDAVPIWTDVTDFPCEPFGRGVLDLFVASYPCQGFSHAGKRLGADDHRHLWPYCRKFIRATRPGWVWLENVEGHVSLGLSTVLADLEEDGYRAAWGIFSAAEVGAPHQRKRVFILAYDKNAERELSGAARPRRSGLADGCKSGELALRNSIGCPHREPTLLPTEAGVDALGDSAASGGKDVAHEFYEGLQGHAGNVNGARREPGGQDRPVAKEGLCGDVWPSRPGERQHAWEPPRVAENPVQQRVQRGASVTGGNDGSGSDGETALSGGGREDRGADKREVKPPMGGNADGPAVGMDFPGCTGLSDSELEEIYGWMERGTNRTDELRMCGNGVVPGTAEKAFRVLYGELCARRLGNAEGAI